LAAPESANGPTPAPSGSGSELASWLALRDRPDVDPVQFDRQTAHIPRTRAALEAALREMEADPAWLAEATQRDAQLDGAGWEAFRAAERDDTPTDADRRAGT